MSEISVIVPVYNAEKYLLECIESILSQSYPDFELLLVNDGSTDRSSQICEEYCQKDNRIQVIHQPNGGVTAARKTGWQKSKGEWIVFVDADDTLQNECFEILITEAKINHCDIVNACYRNQAVGIIWVHKRLGILTRDEYLKSFIYNQTYGVVYASIYKKTIFRDSTFEFDSSLKIGEDILFNIELALRALKVSNIDKVVYDYRENYESVTKLKILHPSYFERYYEVKKGLFMQEKKIDESYFKILQKEKFDNQLSAFFSPHLSFDENYYLKLNVMLKNNVNEEKFIGRDRIYILALKSKISAKLIKAILHWRYVVKNSFKGNAIIKKEILY